MKRNENYQKTGLGTFEEGNLIFRINVSRIVCNIEKGSEPFSLPGENGKVSSLESLNKINGDRGGNTHGDPKPSDKFALNAAEPAFWKEWTALKSRYSPVTDGLEPEVLVCP